jgi:hypothetical protein
MSRATLIQELTEILRRDYRMAKTACRTNPEFHAGRNFCNGAEESNDGHIME